MEVLSDGPAEAEKEKRTVAFASKESGKEGARHRYDRVKTRGPRGQIKSWRLADFEDLDAIQDLMTVSEEDMNTLYNTPCLDNFLEKSPFPIVQLDNYGKIVSFTAFQSYPNIPSVPLFCWIEWIDEKYRLSGSNSENTLFIHYMVWDPDHTTDFMYLLLRTTFLEFIHLKFIIIVKPPFVEIPEVYHEYFLPVNSCDVKGSSKNIQSLYVCPRSTLIEPLLIRRAIAEDTDVLISLLGKTIGNNSEGSQGKDFCFSCLDEFLGCCDRTVLICEVDGVAAGVVVLNSDVDLDSLTDFELMPFHGLRRLYERNVTLSIDTMPTETRTSEIIDALRSQEFDVLDIDSFGLDASIIDLKEDDSAASSDDTYEIDFNALHMTASLQKLIRGTSSESKGLTQEIEYGESYDVRSLDTGEMQSRRDEKLLRITSQPPSPKYDGEPNAFAIEFFAIDHNKLDERQSVEFLEASFSAVDRMDYCIMKIPTDTAPLPLLNHFVKASHRGGKQPRCELYVCHKSTFCRSWVTVREADTSDLEQIQQLLQRVYNSSLIFSEFQNSFGEDSQQRSFALVAESQIVGIALIRYSYDFQKLCHLYDVKEFSVIELHDAESRSIVQHLLVIPPFQSFAKFFLLEIMRLGDVTCMFHLHYQDSKLNSSIPTILGELMPLKPKRPITPRGVQKSTLARLEHDESFAVFFTNTQLLCRMRISTNKIIVVIGASATAFSFFENIIFGSSRDHVYYSNLIWIAPHGTGQELPPNEIRDLMFPVRDKYDRDHRILLSLKAHVHFIYGVMTGINRNEKYIILNNRAVVRYDILILTVGLQFLRPVPEVSRQGKQHCSRNKFHKSVLARFLPNSVTATVHNPVKPNPVNVFEMNTFLEADTMLMAFEHVKARITSGVPAEKVILYGHSLTIFVVMQALLKIGIPGGMIAFVEPFPTREKSITAFEDLSVYNEIINSIRKSGILYYPQFFLYDWTYSSSNRLSTVTFHSIGGQVTFPCLAFLPFDEKLVSDNNFNACNNAGLIYDGRLIIDNQFKTNDEWIYAAGPFTKYSRRYCAPEKAHQYFNSVEVGEKLAEFVRREAESLDDDLAELSEDADTIPTLKKPVMVYCQVPGDFYFFSLRQPGSPVEVEANFESGNTGDILITGDCAMNEGIGYFRLHLDQFGFVQRITCFCKTEVDYMNLYSLYGLHEKLLNNLLVRYDCGMIADFFEYFQEPWAEAIFHGEFHRLSEENMRLLTEEASRLPGTGTVIASSCADQWRSHDSSRLALDVENELSDVKAAIERNVLEFVNYFDEELARYATTKAVEELLNRTDVKDKKERYEGLGK